MKEIIFKFLPPRIVISDNASCFLATTLQSVMKQFGIQWKMVLIYSPMSKGEAERMIGTLKRSVARLLNAESITWDVALLRTVYGYRRRRGSFRFFPFEFMLGHPPRVPPIEMDAVSCTENKTTCVVENLAVSSMRDSCAVRPELSNDTTKVHKFEVASLVFVAKGSAVQPSVNGLHFKQSSPGRTR